MLRKSSLCLLILLTFCGCVSDDADTLLTNSDEPLGVPKIDGETPNVGNVPVGQTTQMSAAEKSKLKQELGSSTQSAKAQSAKEGISDYRAEAEALRKLAKDEQEKRLEQIESRKF